MAVSKGLKVAIGAAVFAALVWGVLAAPGFLSDQDSSVAVLQVQEARR